MLQTLLFSVPDAAVPAVQSAMRAAAAGKWASAARAMWAAADACDDIDEKAADACTKAGHEMMRRAGF